MRANRRNAVAFQAAQLVPFVTELQAARRVWVGFSGGLDSTVLLHAMTRQLNPGKISAIHVNHQLSPAAHSWAQHCRAHCAVLGVALVEETVRIEKRGDGLEKAARELRYAVFEKVVEKNDILLLAHHADDQVETVLYRLLRGAGLRGLAGIPQSRALGCGRLLRPLLKFTRAELEAYGVRHGLSWIEDESNQHTEFDRNYLRHRVIPALAERWPDFRTRIALSADLCADADRLNSVLARADLDLLQERGERLGRSIDIPALQRLDPQRRANVLRYWAETCGQIAPNQRALLALHRDLLMVRGDAAPVVNWPGGQWRRFRQRLYLLPPQFSRIAVQRAPVEWSLSEPLTLADGSVLSAVGHVGQGLKVNPGQRVTIAWRSGGERCKPAGRHGSNSLKTLFQEHGLEPWWRDRVPLLHVDGVLAAVGDLWLNDGFVVGPDEVGFVLCWNF